MPSCGKMIDEVKGGLQSWSLDEEQSTTLAADVGSMDAGFLVTTPRGVSTGISPGIVEIDSELMYCDSVADDGTCTVTPWGRGYLSTTSANHFAGARVISQPTFPRAKVLDAINQTLERVFPDLFAVKLASFTTTVPQITYDLADDAISVLSARWMLPDGRQYWKDVRRWRMNPGGFSNPAVLSNVTVDIADPMMPGRPLEILYAAKPSPLVLESDDFTTVTGLEASIEDVISLGATVQMLPSQELSRLQLSSVEQQNRAQLVAPSAALTSTRYLEARFQTRLAEERKTLRQKYPVRVTREWY